MYTPEAIAQIAKYRMVTIEKWYTVCGAAKIGKPECDVEAKMYDTFRAIHAINPSVVNILYLNSMFDFSAYALHGRMLQLEAEGRPAFLRDHLGRIVSLCNDGNVYCNVTTFDHTKPYVRELWLEALRNATTGVGGVGGVFADHGWGTKIGKPLPGTNLSSLCNGKPPLRTCWNFTTGFAAEFDYAHQWLLNASQDLLARLPQRGPTINGPYSQWHMPACDFAKIAKLAADNSSKHAVVELSQGGCLEDTTQPGGAVAQPVAVACLAAYLIHARRGLFFSCVDPHASSVGALPPYFAEFDKRLGPPLGAARQLGDGKWLRQFRHPQLGRPTNVTYDTTRSTGHIEWADGPAGPPHIWPRPPPPPGPPAPPACGAVRVDTGVAEADLGHAEVAASYEDCCALCEARAGCRVWAWHHEQGNACHFHTREGAMHPKPGCFAGVLNRSSPD